MNNTTYNTELFKELDNQQLIDTDGGGWGIFVGAACGAIFWAVCKWAKKK